MRTDREFQFRAACYLVITDSICRSAATIIIQLILDEHCTLNKGEDPWNLQSLFRNAQLNNFYYNILFTDCKQTVHGTVNCAPRLIAECCHMAN